MGPHLAERRPGCCVARHLFLREQAQARRATKAALGEAPAAWKPREHLRLGRAWLKPKHALCKVRGQAG
eukprot:15150543-Alexandrium_andersonii.AAC.1